MRRLTTSVAILFGGCLFGGCTALLGGSVARASQLHQSERSAVLARARVWTPTDIRSMNLRRGPQGPDSFAPGATVHCDYQNVQLAGKSPKFACRIGADDDVKVKHGGGNGEVYGELLATRLLWALGFGADRMYPVNVICRGCPETLGGIARPDGERRFAPAVIERKMAGRKWAVAGDSGWSWEELDVADTGKSGAPLAHRDALKLLAVFLQHTDSKPEQQRIVCLDSGDGPEETCARPFLMISDVGLTFGRANWANRNDTGSVSLEAWRETPVWKTSDGCVGNLPKSFTGTLHDPVISEAGRRFLANLLAQLSDRQLRDLFEVAQVQLRPRVPGRAASGFATPEEWVRVFKEKRQEIATRRCA
jgi:hypothetical protein